MSLGRFLSLCLVWIFAIALTIFVRLLYVLCIPFYMGLTGFGTSRLNKSDPMNKYSQSFWPLWQIKWPRPPSWRAVSKPKLFVRKRIVTQGNTSVVAGERRNSGRTDKAPVVQEVLPPLEGDRS